MLQQVPQLSVFYFEEGQWTFAPYKRNERKTEPRNPPFMYHLSLKTNYIQVLIRMSYIVKQ